VVQAGEAMSQTERESWKARITRALVDLKEELPTAGAPRSTRARDAQGSNSEERIR
jgi:hypothetical protein